jgi:hypothetical protein
MFAKSWKRRENMGKAVDRLAKEEVVVEGSGPKEKQKTPYRDINSPEYRAAVEKQKQRMAKDKAAEPGKKMLKKEEVEQIEEDRYDDMLDAMMKANGKRLMAKNAKEVQRHKDINSGKALNQLVKKNPGVLKTYAKDVKRTKKLYGEEVEQIDEISTKTLARAASAASDPMKHYDDDEKYHDPQKFADHAKKTKDAKSAAAVQGAANAKGHYPRPGHSVGVYDKLAYRAPARVTASGKANKQDVKTLKKNIRSEEVDQIDERSLSTSEKATMEKNVKGMKKSVEGFKARYGKDAKSVMYATATKQAKGE